MFFVSCFCCQRLTRRRQKPAAPLKIGVTLHPYYSWTANVVGNLPGYEVRALLPGDIDAGDYQPRPQDIKRLADLDVAHRERHRTRRFHLSDAEGVGQHARGDRAGERRDADDSRRAAASGVNSHTFISFSNAIQQTYAIQRALARLRPQDAPALQQNAAEYARRLRAIKAKAASQLADAKITRVVTVHDGYGYLLQEFGLEVGGVVQPAHGLTPSAGELRDMVALLKREKITVVFSEATFPEPLLKVLRDEAGVTVYIISHIASGPFTADKFEREMQAERRHDDPRAGELNRDQESRRNFSGKQSHSYLLISCSKIRCSRFPASRCVPRARRCSSNFSLSVERGTLHAIVGPNGAGKTTLLSAILGLVPFDGRIVAHWTGRGRIAYVPQQFHVDRTLPVTVADFLALTRQRRPGVSRRGARDAQADFAAARSRGAARVRGPAAVGAVRRRAAARAARQRARSAARAADSRRARERPRRSRRRAGSTTRCMSLKGEMTVLMVSHDSEQVRRIADRVTAPSRN